MDIVVVFNGLGNQMSQYAFFLSKKKRGCKCLCIFDPRSKSRHNGLELEKLFGIELSNGAKVWLYTELLKRINGRIIRRIAKLMGINIICEPINYDYSDAFLRQGKGWLNYYIGGWHSEKYFKYIREDILRSFSFPVWKEEDTAFLSIVNNIKEHYDQSVSLHIRRGDYLKSKPGDWYYYGDVATPDYYKKAESYIESKLKSPTYYVFSDDIEWCKSNFTGNNYVFVDCNNAINSWRDMFLMSKCKHHIIANSSFSWWGAWLSEDKDGITIRPDRFLANVETKDFYPESWIAIRRDENI